MWVSIARTNVGRGLFIRDGWTKFAERTTEEEAAARRSKPQSVQTVPQPGSMEWFEAQKKSCDRCSAGIRPRGENSAERCAAALIDEGSRDLAKIYLLPGRSQSLGRGDRFPERDRTSGTQRLPGGRPRKKSQRHTRPAALSVSCVRLLPRDSTWSAWAGQHARPIACGA
jgi:hypothetical protein